MLKDDSEIMADERPIRCIHEAWLDGAFYKVGRCGVERIEAYGEPALHGYIPWFRVIVNGKILHRIPAHHTGGVRYDD